MEDNLEEAFLIFDVLDRWGLDEIESVLCPFCDAPNDVEVTDPDETQEEYCGSCEEISLVPGRSKTKQTRSREFMRTQNVTAKLRT